MSLNKPIGFYLEYLVLKTKKKFVKKKRYKIIKRNRTKFNIYS